MSRNLRLKKKELIMSLTAGQSFKTAFFAYLGIIAVDLLLVTAFIGVLCFIFG